MSSVMTPSFRARPRHTAYCATLIALAACSVEERPLKYGVGSSNNLSQAGRGSYGSDNAGGEGGDQASAGAGAQSLGGSDSSVSGAAGTDAEAGAPANNGGSPATGGSPPSGGSQASAGTSAGGVVNTAGSASSGSSNGGGGSGGSSAGTSGSQGSGGTGVVSTDVAPCGDADKNGVQDCLETVVKNATFHVDAKDWKADPSVVAAWKADDAFGQANSGSISVTVTTGDGSANWSVSATNQCLPAWQDTQFELAARVLLASGQGAGNAQISLAMFGNDDCAGSFLGSTTPVLTAQAGSWQALHTSAKLAAGTRSVMVRLALAKPGTQPSLEARFDDILLREK